MPAENAPLSFMPIIVQRLALDQPPIYRDAI